MTNYIYRDPPSGPKTNRMAYALDVLLPEVRN